MGHALAEEFVLFTASYDVSIVGEHIPGIKNGPADVFSRGNHVACQSQVPGAQ